MCPANAVQSGNGIGAHVDLIENTDVGAVFPRPLQIYLARLVQIMQVLLEEKGVRDGLLHADADHVGVTGENTVVNRFYVIKKHL